MAMRYRTRGDSELIVPGELSWHREGPGLVAELPSEAGAVWCRDGRCEDVLADLFELPSLEPWLLPVEHTPLAQVVWHPSHVGAATSGWWWTTSDATEHRAERSAGTRPRSDHEFGAAAVVMHVRRSDPPGGRAPPCATGLPRRTVVE